MPNLKLQPLASFCFCACCSLFSRLQAHAISKCQDANGKWHYGDNAASVCGDARITIIDDRGRKIDEVAPPMTVEEFNALEAEEKRKAAEESGKAKRELEKETYSGDLPTRREHYSSTG